ncbi:hypothetical protein [Pedobacter segetis]|nr:hypothetical protein [Pedobacter segetis]
MIESRLLADDKYKKQKKTQNQDATIKEIVEYFKVYIFDNHISA